MDVCSHCGTKNRLITELGSQVCVICGAENFAHMYGPNQAYTPYNLPITGPATYTRTRRFKKYLQRAAMNQSACTIPPETWDYLLDGQPYRGPTNIVRRLKKAPKQVRKKCYDSLPLLVRMLCPHIRVPSITEREKERAMGAFSMLDNKYRNGEPFVSYLYALEYILGLIGRGDMLFYINKISCRKRRAAYKFRLDRIFKNSRCIHV
jgi:hypothetical protein